MNTRTDRPVFLDLRKIRMPVMAVVSIFHRASGILMVLSIPAFIYLLDLSLRDEAGFRAVIEILRSTPVKLFGVVLVWALAHHLFAGIRFLLLDMDQGVDVTEARKTAWMVHAAAIAATLMAIGVML